MNANNRFGSGMSDVTCDSKELEFAVDLAVAALNEAVEHHNSQLDDSSLSKVMHAIEMAARAAHSYVTRSDDEDTVISACHLIRTLEDMEESAGWRYLGHRLPISLVRW